MSLLFRLWPIGIHVRGPPPLGRWCLPSHPKYEQTCNVFRKGQFADIDNGHVGNESKNEHQRHEKQLPRQQPPTKTEATSVVLCVRKQVPTQSRPT